MKKLMLLFFVFMLAGCAISGSMFISGITFVGEDVIKNDLGENSILINRENTIKLRTSCTQYQERAGMISFIVPLPPIIPAPKSKKHSMASEKLVLKVSAERGENVNPEDFEVIILITNEVHKSALVKSYLSQFDPQFRAYDFGTQLTCGEIKAATLKIKYKNGNYRSYIINFKEGTKWSFGYMSA